MNINNSIKKQIVKSPDAVVLRKIAKENGMSTLISHGAYLVVNGITTLDEVMRVTRGFEEV